MMPPRERPLRRVLIVAYYFPPISTSGSMRPLAFCRHLPSFGWQPSVVSVAGSDVFPRLPLDDELSSRLPSGIEVARVGHGDPVGALLAWRDSLWGSGPAARTGVTAPPAGDRVRSPLSRLKSELTDHALAFPDRQCWWKGPAIRAALSGARPDVVLATGGPWTALLAGRQVAHHFGAPFVADFRDPWARNPYRNYTRAMAWRHRRAESSVCRSARFVIANTEELREHFVVDYPRDAAKFVTIPNGFDGTTPVLGEAAGYVERAGDVAGVIEVCHFGTVYGQRSPVDLFTALERAMQRGALAPGGIRLRFVGSWDVHDAVTNELAARLERAGLVTREAAMPHHACLAAMRQANLLLALQPESPLQVPAKIYEYASAARPILVVGGEGATAALVVRHGLGVCYPSDPTVLEPLLISLAAGQLPEPPRPGATAAFDYANLTGRLAALLSAAAEDPAASQPQHLPNEA